MKNITIDELRRLHDTEGLIIQGCGGDLEEWVAGINELLTKENILLDGDTFKDIYVFEHDDRTNLLFSLEKVKMDWNKLAIWRLSSHEAFGGTWLSDYVPNRLGGFVIEKAKPDCPLIGQDGNIFNLMEIAARTLKDNDMRDQAAEMQQRIMNSGSYDEALCIIGEYVNITSVDGDHDLDQDEDFGISMI